VNDAAGGLVVVYLILFVVWVVGLWKTFEKAGEPGWAGIIPIYNFIVLLRIAGRPLWWIVLMLIPCVNIIVYVIVGLDVARNFGRTPGFGVGLGLLPFVFYPILGFGDARYEGRIPPGQ
jgi:hypothetical protein